MAVLAYGCGGRAGSDGAAGGSLPTSAGSGPAGAGSGGEPSGPSSQSGGSGGSGGGGARASTQCKTVNSKMAYGPIGEPQPIPLTAVRFADCPTCSGVRDLFASRTAAGYGFVWRVGFDPNTPEPNLLSWTAASNFKGGAPLSLVPENTAKALAIVPAPNGFVATTCSLDSKPQWIELNRDLEVARGSSVVAPDAPCGQSIIWTGEVYLTAFADARGLGVASLDEQGARVGEQVLSEGVEAPVLTRFSKNGERVLFVFGKDRARPWYGVLDLHGTPLGAVQPFSEDSGVSNLALVATGDGWWVASSVNNRTGAQLTGISRDGLVWREQRVLYGHPRFGGFTPSVSGGSLLVATVDSGGQYYDTSIAATLIDDAGEVVYSEQTQIERDEPFIPGVVVDPLRDLVIKPLPLKKSEPTIVVVQEYGCLD
jgi:hypothetical protein